MDTKLNRVGLLMERYVQDRGQRGYSPATMRLYRHNNTEFLKYLEEDERIDDLKQVDRQVVSRFQSYLYTKERALSFKTQELKLVAVRNLFRWCERQGLIYHDPTKFIEFPRKQQSLPKDIFKEEEIKKVLDAVDIDSKLGLRDKAVLELLYSTAIRSGELCDLTIFDVQKENQTVHIRRGKGGKERYVPIGEVALGYIEEYLEHARDKFVNAKNLPWLFITYRGTKMKNTGVAPIVQKYAGKAGINRYTHAHMIRHSTATHMLKRGADIRAIQELLGHSKLETTQLYTKVSIQDLKKIHRKTHPRERGI